MASKKPAKIASRKQNASQQSTTAVKDDGHLYGVFDAASRRRVYPGDGVTLGEAERLAGFLVAPSYIQRLDAVETAA